MKKLITIITLSLIALFIYSNQPQPQPAQKAITTPVEEYTYTITSIDKEGINGQSTTNNTGIFITHELVKDLKLNESDNIKVSFPKGDWETITKVTKIN